MTFIKHLHNVETRHPPQAFLSLDVQCRDDVFWIQIDVCDYKQLMISSCENTHQLTNIAETLHMSAEETGQSLRCTHHSAALSLCLAVVPVPKQNSICHFREHYFAF